MKGARERIHTTIYNLSIVLGDKISHSQNLMKLLSGSKHRKGAGSICLCRLEGGRRGREADAQNFSPTKTWRQIACVPPYEQCVARWKVIHKRGSFCTGFYDFSFVNFVIVYLFRRDVSALSILVLFVFIFRFFYLFCFYFPLVSYPLFILRSLLRFRFRGVYFCFSSDTIILVFWIDFAVFFVFIFIFLLFTASYPLSIRKYCCNSF